MAMIPYQYIGAVGAVLLLLTIPASSADVPPDAVGLMFLDAQNAFRAKTHDLPPLQWDNKLMAFAQEYAKKRKADCALEHSDDTKYGENIFQGTGTQWQPADAVKSWADDEMKFYDPKKNECVGGVCGHYTQVVWRNTTKVGCARVVCDNDGGVFMTCNYDPPGNFVGQRPF